MGGCEWVDAGVNGNIPPTARDVPEPYAVTEGGTLKVIAERGVLVNDTDGGNAPLTALIATPPAHAARFILAEDGGFEYVHDGSETVADSFTYTAFDGIDKSQPAKVNIEITLVNDVPTALDDGPFVVSQGDKLTVPSERGFLANDYDDDGPSLDVTIVSWPSNGKLSVGQNGGFKYSHDGSDTLTDAFRYKLTDGIDESREAIVRIEVDARPVADDDGPYELEEGGLLKIGSAAGLLANDYDPEGGSLTAVLESGPANGRLTLSADGGFSYEHDGSEGSFDVFTYRAKDMLGFSFPASVTLRVTSVNDLPMAFDDGPYTLSEGGTLHVQRQGGLLANDIDAEGDKLTVTVEAGPSFGTLNLNGDGSFVYVHDGGETTNDSFTYRAFDKQGPSNTAVVAIKIVPVNDSPVAADDGPFTVAEGGTLTVQADQAVLKNDTDTENSPLTAVLVTPPANGTVNLLANGQFSYVHDGSETVNDRFTYVASDGSAESNQATVSITVTPVNDPPIAAGDGPYWLGAGATLTVSSTEGVLANDIDPEGANLESRLETGPKNGTLTLNADGSFTYTQSGTASLSDSFTYRASDGTLSSDPVTVTLNVNSPPKAYPDTYEVASGGTVVAGAANGVLSNDTDAEGDVLTAVVVTQPAHGFLRLQSDGGFQYQHDGSLNSDAFEYAARDAHGASTPTRVTLSLLLANNAPELISAPCANVQQSRLWEAYLSDYIVDPDGETLSYAMSAAPKHGRVNLDTATGYFVYTPYAGSRGIDRFSVTATDPRGGTIETRATVLVGAARIMPLGDSITSGVTAVVGGTAEPAPDLRTGYRDRLYRLLTGKGYAVDFVGSLSGGSGAGILDPDHEGHGGFTSSDLASSVTGWLSLQSPDIVLLHSGTNGFNVNAESDVAAILNEVDKWEAATNQSVWVVLAKIINRNPFQAVDVIGFNANVEAMATKRQDYNDGLFLANLHDALIYSDVSPDSNDLSGDPEGLHPSQTGYEKLAQAWLSRLESIMCWGAPLP